MDVNDASGALGEEGEVLAAYKTEGNPAEYLDAYRALTSFVEKSLDAYKVRKYKQSRYHATWTGNYVSQPWQRGSILFGAPVYFSRKASHVSLNWF